MTASPAHYLAAVPRLPLTIEVTVCFRIFCDPIVRCAGVLVLRDNATHTVVFRSIRMVTRHTPKNLRKFS